MPAVMLRRVGRRDASAWSSVRTMISSYPCFSADQHVAKKGKDARRNARTLYTSLTQPRSAADVPG